jgi:hypothetical protein
MKKIIVYKNERGYGPLTRPTIAIGDELEIVSDDGVINTRVRVVQVPDHKAGVRCVMCSMADTTDDGIRQCLCNAAHLRAHLSIESSVCTLNPSTMQGELGIYTIFKQIGEEMEEL